MEITWETLDKYKITWEEIDALHLSWEQIETLSSDEIFAIARERIPRFRKSEEELPKDIESIVEKIYEVNPDLAPKKRRFTYSALQWFGLQIAAWAIGKALDNSGEIAGAIIKIISILSTLPGE